MRIDAIPLRGAKIYLGHMPSAQKVFKYKDMVWYHDDMESLKDLDATHIFVLSTVDDLKKHSQQQLFQTYRELGFKVMHFPIQDYGAPKDMEEFDFMVQKAYNLILGRQNILVHCNAGLGRTGLFVCGILMKAGLSFHNALTYARKFRFGLVEEPVQFNFLRRYEGFLNHGKN